MSLCSYPTVKLGCFSGRTSLWGEDREDQTPIKDIVARVGQYSPPGYAGEFKKDSNYKIFIHKEHDESMKAAKRSAA